MAGCSCGRMASVMRHLASGSEADASYQGGGGGGGIPSTAAQASSIVGRLVAGSLIAGFIPLGLRLGLYHALAAAPPGGLTSAEVAGRTGKVERWVREWLAAQAAASVVQWEEAADGTLRFRLSPAMREILLDGDSPNYISGFVQLAESVVKAVPNVEKSFTTGLGYSYDSMGDSCSAAISDNHIPVFVSTLIPKVLPLLAGGEVVAALTRGCRVADVGCGAGGPTMALAAAFPNSQFHGFELSTASIKLARAEKARSAITNFEMHDVRTNPLVAEAAARGKFDFVMAYDVLHDMTRPEMLCAEVKKALAIGGTWLVVDIKNHGSIAENIRRLRLDAAVKYSISMGMCMSSALSEPGGAGLGTLGLTLNLAAKMFADAGFSKCRPFEVAALKNQLFEVSH